MNYDQYLSNKQAEFYNEEERFCELCGQKLKEDNATLCNECMNDGQNFTSSRVESYEETVSKFNGNVIPHFIKVRGQK